MRKWHQCPLSLCHMKAQWEDGHLQAKKRALPGTGLAHTLALDFAASRTVRNEFSVATLHQKLSLKREIYSYSRMPMNKNRRNEEFENHHWILKLVEEYWIKREYLHSPKKPSYKLFTNYKKNIYLQHRNLADAMFKSASPVSGQNSTLSFLTWWSTFVEFLPKMHNLNVIIRQVSQTHKLKGILPNNSPVLWKNVTLEKVKGRPRNCSRLREVLEMWQRSAVQDLRPGSCPGEGNWGYGTRPRC